MNRDDIIDHALDICREYESLDLTLTLRQLYYQFVARGLLPNGQKVYKRLGSTLTTARYDGRFPIRYIEDRGRVVRPGDYDQDCTDLDSCDRTAARYARAIPDWSVKRSRWFNQQTHVSVWVEKEALSGVVGPTCDDLDVGWFACKGYPSVSSLADWIKQTHSTVSDWDNETSQASIIYLGDHDPDGLEIPQSIERNVRTLMSTLGKHFPFHVERVALTTEQIREHNPPPFPAKMTSARFQKYVATTGLMDAWELDALDPVTMRTLIRSKVEAHWDARVHEKNVAEVEYTKGRLIDRMRQDGWMQSALED